MCATFWLNMNFLVWYPWSSLLSLSWQRVPDSNCSISLGPIWAHSMGYSKSKNNFHSNTLNRANWNFPGGPAVRILHFHCRGHSVQSLVTEQRSCKLAPWPKNKYIKQYRAKLSKWIFCFWQWLHSTWMYSSRKAGCCWEHVCIWVVLDLVAAEVSFRFKSGNETYRENWALSPAFLAPT